jgi:hypothetical protein
MAFEERVSTTSQSYRASGDLSASQFCFVVLDSNGRVAVATSGSMPIGVLQDAPAALDRVCRVAKPSCTTFTLCGGTVTKGGPVSVGTGGKAVDAVSGSYVVGWARETGASGSVIAIDLEQRAAKM